MSHEKKEIDRILKNFNSGKIAEALKSILTLINQNPEKLEYSFLYAKTKNIFGPKASIKKQCFSKS